MRSIVNCFSDFLMSIFYIDSIEMNSKQTIDHLERADVYLRKVFHNLINSNDIQNNTGQLNSSANIYSMILLA